MRVILAILAILVSIAATGAALAQEPPGGQVRLTLDQYEQLMHNAQHRAGGPNVTWGRGTLEVTLPGRTDRFLSVRLSASAQLVGKGDGRVVLLPGDVVIEEVVIDGEQAALQLRDGAHVAIVSEGTDGVDVQLTYLVPLRPGAAGRSALIPVPPLPGSTLRIEGGGDRVEIWPGGRLQAVGGTLVATIPSSPAIALRIDDGSGGARVRRAEYAMTVDASGDGATIAATFDVHATGEKASVRLAPESVPLVNVTAGGKALVSSVRDGWHVVELSGRGRHEIEARLRVAVDRTQGQPRVALKLDRAPITRVSALIAGKRVVTFEPAVPVSTTSEGEGDGAQTRAEGFLPPSDEVTVQWTEERPEPEKLVRINTDTYQLVSIQEGVVRSKVHVGYEILRGDVRELHIQIPDGAVLYKVTGDTVEDWRTFARTDEGAPRQVQITLGRERTGDYELVLELEQVIGKVEGIAIAVPVIRPLRSFRETGVVALFDGSKVGFAPAEQSGYTKVGQDALPLEIRQGLERTVSQAWRHIGPPATIASELVAVELRETLFDAYVNALYSVKEGAILANATVEVEVKSGRSDRLVLTFPETVTILAVTAPALSKKGELEDFDAGEGRKAYELRFSQELEGTIEAHLEFELLPKDGSGTIRLPDVQVHGAEVQEGSLGITAETGIEVQESSALELRKVDAAELPDGVRRRAIRGEEILLGYTWAHAPWQLDLEVQRHDTVETLKAQVTSAWLETTVYEDGHMVTRATFEVRNDDRQFLRMTLPEGSKVWSVSADGQPIKAVSDGTGAVAIPLRKGRTARVEVVYQARRDPLGSVGSVELFAPQSDVVVTDLQWVVRVPREYALHGIDTRMQEENADLFRAPTTVVAGAMPLALPPASDVRVLLFRLPVQEPSEAAAQVSFNYVSRPGDWFGQTLWIAGLVVLLLVTFRRAGGRKLGILGTALLAIGLGSIVGRIGFWGVDDTEITVAVVTLVVAALAGWWGSRRRDDAEEAL